MARAVDTRAVPVRDIMSSPIVTVDHEEIMPRVFLLMQENNFRHMPVTFQGRIIGMLSVSDFLNYFTARFKFKSPPTP